jgi:hypothetical protein
MTICYPHSKEGQHTYSNQLTNLHCKKPVFFCDVTKIRRRFAGHQHFGKRNVEERQNERDVVKKWRC